MTIAVDLGRKAAKQAKQNLIIQAFTMRQRGVQKLSKPVAVDIEIFLILFLILAKHVSIVRLSLCYAR